MSSQWSDFFITILGSDVSNVCDVWIYVFSGVWLNLREVDLYEVPRFWFCFWIGISHLLYQYSTSRVRFVAWDRRVLGILGILSVWCWVYQAMLSCWDVACSLLLTLLIIIVLLRVVCFTVFIANCCELFVEYIHVHACIHAFTHVYICIYI